MNTDRAYNNLLWRLAVAIAEFEGFFKPGTLAARNNNPGNLRSWGNRPIRDGFALFPSVDDGARALYSQIDRNIRRDLTLEEFFAGKPGVYPGYAPAADRNNPQRYAAFVARYLPAYRPGETLLTYFWENLDKLAGN